MKGAIAGKKQQHWLRRVEEILGKLGIEGEKVSEAALEAEFRLSQLHWQIREVHHSNKWEEYDKAQAEVEGLVAKTPALKET